MAPVKKKRKIANGTEVSDKSSARPTEKDSSPTVDESQSSKPQQRRSLFVRSLPPSTTSESLTALFSDSYPIKHATAVIDPNTKQCRGYGFVTFVEAEDAQSAQKEFNGHTLDGRKLRVELAEPRHRDNEGVQSEQGGNANPTKKIQRTPQPSRLIVRNLPWSIKTSDDLAKLFMSYGKVKQAYIPKTRHGRQGGFGFVVMRGRKNAEKALGGVNGKEVGGRTLAVDWAVNKDVYEDIMQRGSTRIDGEANASSNDAQQPDVDFVDEAEADLTDGPESEEDDVEDVTSDNENDDDDDEDSIDVQMESEDEEGRFQEEDRSATIFVRNLPFSCTDEDLEDHFAAFGKTRYARVVMDPATERSKGTGFVCFYDTSDADGCFRNAPRQTDHSSTAGLKNKDSKQVSNSILQNHESDPTGQYTIDGRVLQVSRAVEKSQANQLTQEGVARRRKQNEDKRRLYLLSEGTISSKSKLWESISPTERNMRDASAKQRKSLIESNPSLHLSLTRLSIRNIPRSVTSKALKSLAREAVVGFATDVKAGSRQRLSREELARGGEDMEVAEKSRKKAGKGVVKQAKVVFEGQGGSKVDELSGAGRSRGYGFIEYYTHRSALMGLRWLNGHAIGYQVREAGTGNRSIEEPEDRKKRLIVEFAIENAQVVMRRKEKEKKARERSEATVNGTDPKSQTDEVLNNPRPPQNNTNSRKRKMGSDSLQATSPRKVLKPGSGKRQASRDEVEPSQKRSVNEKIAKRNRIVGRKRAVRARRDRKQ